MPDNPTAAATDVETWIATWSPNDDADDAVVDIARAAVATAKPRTRTEARNALRYAVTYLTHRHDHGETIAPEAAFASDAVDHYRRHDLTGATGTKAAVASHLKRLHPAVGFAGTTRTTNVDKRAVTRPAPRPVVEPVTGPNPAVATTIDSWAPTNMHPERWDRIAGVCRHAVTAANPTRPSRARDLLRSASYLAAFTDARHRPLRIDVVFAAATIEHFIAVYANGITTRSAATHASNLHALRDAVGLPLDVERRRYPVDRSGPYDSADIDDLYRQATHLPTEGRRRQATAALDVVFGAGATPTEAVAVRPADVATDADGNVTVTLADVTVPVLADHAATLAGAASAAAANGDRYLLGGRDGSRRNRFNQLFGANELGRWGIDVDSTRARYTWLVTAVNDPAYGTFADFVTVARLRSLTVLDQLLPHIISAAAATDIGTTTAGDCIDLEVAS